MAELICSECAGTDFRFCYIIMSNGKKQYKRICSHCGKKHNDAVKKDIAENCGYELKEYTGKFRSQFVLNNVVSSLEQINKECPFCGSPNCIMWFKNVYSENSTYYGINCQYCNTKIANPKGFNSVKDKIVALDLFNISTAKEFIYQNNEKWLHVPLDKLSEYQEYLKSDKWKRKRNIRLALDNGACVLCFSEHQLQTHHVTYERLFDEETKDIMTVCKSCHETIHGRKF